MKKKLLTILVAVLMSAMCQTGDTTSYEYSVVDSYKLTLRVRVPRIYDNMESLGYRKYQTQTIRGELRFVYRSDGSVQVETSVLTNITHKINGKNVTYATYPTDDDDWMNLTVAVGNNRTMKFRQGGIDIQFIAEPSYNIGEINEDNTLVLRLSGTGSITSSDRLNFIRGSATGRIGCGCTDFGHISPTRLWLSHLTDIVVDVAPVYGTFNARLIGRRWRLENDRESEK